MGFITSIWEWIRQVAGLVFPFFAKARDFRGIGQQVRWAIHAALVIAVLIGLWFVGFFFNLESLLSRAPLQVRKIWLPLLFFLVYVLSWLGWWLWKLLGPEEESSAFPDVDTAWDEAVRALNHAGIDITEVPLFLILGQSAGGETALFNAAQLQLTVKQAPPRADAPIHVYANRDAVYITCAGASLLGRQAAILGGKADSVPSLPGAPPPAADADFDPFKTLQPKGKFQQEIQGILADAHQQGRDLTDEEKQKIRLLDAEEKAQDAPAVKSRPNLSKNTAEVEFFTARFRHLCRVIVQERQPYCPLNGILVLVPFASTDSDDDANQTAALCQQDLTTARQMLKVYCPIFTLFCDLETAPGFSEFIERFPEQERQRRVGQRLPLVPDIEPTAVTSMVEGGVRWICQALFPTWVYKLLRVESPGGKDMQTVIRGNVHLYQLMGHMRERQKRLSRILTRGILIDLNAPPLFGGCYIAGTGSDPAKQQAFVAGVFRRLVENQNYVSWTDTALKEERDYQALTRYGFTGVAVFAATLIAYIGWHYWRGANG